MADLKDRIQEIVSELREHSRGRNKWYVRHKTDGGVCIWFEEYERHEAKEWWREHPDHHNEWELVLLKYQDQSERLMAAAADLILELTHK